MERTRQRLLAFLLTFALVFLILFAPCLIGYQFCRQIDHVETLHQAEQIENEG